MSRYRPPTKPGSPYITAEGYQRLDTELHQLWLRRRDVTKALTAAAAEGDRSENAEYIYRKKELREIDRRVRYLSKRLDQLKRVDRIPEDKTTVFFGAWVELEDEEGSSVEYRIVGPDEFDPKQHWISMDSPMGKALLGKRLDQEFSVTLPRGVVEYCVVGIRYR